MMVAVATDNGEKFIDRHFGDAKYYDIYKLTNTNALFIKRIENVIEEQEAVHANPEKAKGVAGLLKKENVTVVISKIFGPNIKRIRKNFVCVIMNDESIKDALERLIYNWALIVTEWEKGAERNHCILRKSL